MMFFATLLSVFIHSSATTTESIPQSFMGDYKVQWKEFGPCPPEKRGTNEFFTDIHLTKRQKGLSEIVGKTTLLVPFDDNMTMNIHFAILGSNSAWLPNSYTFPLTRACSSMISFLGDAWIGFLKNMGMTPKCPIEKGVYELKGYDVNNMLRINMLPKEFIFGRYKFTVDYLRFRKLVGCVYTVLQVVPARQKKNKKN